MRPFGPILLPWSLALLHLPLLRRMPLLHLLGLLSVALLHLLFLRVVVIVLGRLLMLFFLLLLQLSVLLVLLGRQLVLLLLIFSIRRGVSGVGCRHGVRRQLAGVSGIILGARASFISRSSPVLACCVGRSRLVFASRCPGGHSASSEISRLNRSGDGRLAPVGDYRVLAENAGSARRPAAYASREHTVDPATLDGLARRPVRH